MVKLGNLLEEERIVGELFMQPFQFFSRIGFIFVAQVIKGQQNPRKRQQIMAMLSHKRQLFYSLVLIAFKSVQAQHPADGRSLAADDVFAKSGSKISIVVIGPAGQQLLGIAIGRLSQRESAELLF